MYPANSHPLRGLARRNIMKTDADRPCGCHFATFCFGVLQHGEQNTMLNNQFHHSPERAKAPEGRKNTARVRVG